MPEAIAQLEEPHTVLGGEDVAVLVEVREVCHARTEPPIVALLDVAGRGIALELAEVLGKDELLLVREILATKDEDGVGIHPGLDRRDLGGVDRPGDVDAGHLAGERAAERADRDRHSSDSGAHTLRYGLPQRSSYTMSAIGPRPTGPNRPIGYPMGMMA